MDQTIATVAISAILLLVIAASFVRSRREDDGTEAAGLDIRETLRDAEEYLGVKPSGKSGDLADELDMAPARMIAQLASSDSRHSAKR